MKALIVVDVQNDFVKGGALEVPQGDEVIPIINDLMDHYDLVVATQDFHPENHGSFAANHEGKALYDVVDLNGLDQVLWPVHCVQGTRGAEFCPGLNTNKIDKVFQKGVDPGIDSYSGFFDNGKRRSTGLSEFLKGEEVTHVHITGLAADYCVKFTALDALSEGFITTLITDATRGVNLKNGDVKRAMKEMEEAGAIMMHSDLILRPAKLESA